MRYSLRQNVFGRWIIGHPEDERLAWSGSRWVVVNENGLPDLDGKAQVSNFGTEGQARRYADMAFAERLLRGFPGQ